MLHFSRRVSIAVADTAYIFLVLLVTEFLQIFFSSIVDVKVEPPYLFVFLQSVWFLLS